MSFIARKRPNDSIEDAINAKGIKINDANKDFYCLYCNCIYHFRSGSNKKAAHFFRVPSAQHSDDCHMPFAESIHGDVSWETAEGFTLESFLEEIINSPERSGRNTTGSVGGGTNQSSIQHLSTVRQLYKFCMYHDNNAHINETLQVKDILVGRKTSYLYSKYVRGIKLIEARLYGYDRDTRILRLYYPYNADSYTSCMFKLYVTCTDKTYNKIRKRAWNDRENNTVIVLADWETSNGIASASVSNTNQIAVLSR